MTDDHLIFVCCEQHSLSLSLTSPTKKVKTLKGISCIHYMQSEQHGVRIWHVANVGAGELITWATIMELHNGKKVVDPCVPLIHVPAAFDPARAAASETSIPSNQFEPKIHRSHRNVKKSKVQRALQSESKRLTREFNYQQKAKDVLENVESVNGLRCQWCYETMFNAESLQRHQQQGCTRIRGRAKKKLSETTESAEAMDAEKTTTTNSTAIENVGFESTTVLTKGYAWVSLRAQVTEIIGPRARLILEQAFQRGVAKGGDRQSCFQMVCLSHRTHLT